MNTSCWNVNANILMTLILNSFHELRFQKLDLQFFRFANKKFRDERWWIRLLSYRVTFGPDVWIQTTWTKEVFFKVKFFSAVNSVVFKCQHEVFSCVTTTNCLCLINCWKCTDSLTTVSSLFQITSNRYLRNHPHTHFSANSFSILRQ